MNTFIRPWFKAKRFGWGWYPITWQGWSVIIIYCIVSISLFLAIDSHSHSSSDTLINFALPFIGLTSLLLALCYTKGVPPRWSWGRTSFEAKTCKILKKIKKSQSILLHCHPSPDPDSVGSALAMKFALEQMGKKVTVIRGDSKIPRGFMHFPGAQEIIDKNYFEIDLKDFDLFIILDSSREGVSRERDVVFPESLDVINIDHHRTNSGCGSISLVDPSYPANCLLLFDIFKEWNIKLDANIASNLFVGAYTDTGGFKYEGVGSATFIAVGEIVSYIPNMPRLISIMENTKTPGMLAFEALALSSIRVVLDGKVALSVVTYEELQDKKITDEDMKAGFISSILRGVPEWLIVGALIESTPGVVRASFRSAHADVYDLSKLVTEFGGGGHKAAAGAVLTMPVDTAVDQVVEKIKIVYNL